MSDQPDQPDETARPAAGSGVLVLRAVFTPNGEQPPAEFMADMMPLRIPVTLDPATGELTSDNAGMSLDGDMPAMWHPDPDQENGGEEDAAPGGAASVPGMGAGKIGSGQA